MAILRRLVPLIFLATLLAASVSAQYSPHVWGNSLYGQLNIPVEAQSDVSAVSTTYRHVLALKNGGVIGWGWNDDGQTNVPVQAQSGVSAVSTGGYHNLALKSDGSVVGWGHNLYNQSYIFDEAKSGVVAIAAGALHSLVLKSDGTLFKWGYRDFSEVDTPVLPNIRAIAAGALISVVLYESFPATSTLAPSTVPTAATPPWAP